MERRCAFISLWFVCDCSLGGCDGAAPAAGPKPRCEAEVAARVDALEQLIPSQSHMMADIGDHFTNLWFARRAENWPLADFHLSETRSHLHRAVRRIPVRKDNRGQDINLVSILEAFENSQLTRLEGVIDGRDKVAFERLYKESLTVCYSCHVAADKPYLRPQIPTQPASRIMNFDPKADWPL